MPALSLMSHKKHLNTSQAFINVAGNLEINFHNSFDVITKDNPKEPKALNRSLK